MLPKNVSETELSALFSEYGTIRDLQILRGSEQTSKGVNWCPIGPPNNLTTAFCSQSAAFLLNLSTIPSLLLQDALF